MCLRRNPEWNDFLAADDATKATEEATRILKANGLLFMTFYFNFEFEATYEYLQEKKDLHILHKEKREDFYDRYIILAEKIPQDKEISR